MSDAAVATVVSGVVTVATLVVGFLTMWFKLKYAKESVEQKVDQNTKITQEGAEAAVNNAKEAVTAANSAAETTDSISKKLNGGLHDAMGSAIEPVYKALLVHMEQDAKDLGEVKGRFDDLTAYVHQRNHDVLSGMQTLSNQLNVLAEMLKHVQPAGGKP